MYSFKPIFSASILKSESEDHQEEKLLIVKRLNLMFGD